MVIQTASSALQNGDQQFLSDPRSEGCLRRLADVLGVFLNENYAPQPVDLVPLQEQGTFTPQNPAVDLPGSPESWHPPALADDGSVPAAGTVDNASSTQLSDIHPPPAPSVSSIESAHSEASDSSSAKHSRSPMSAVAV